MGVDPAKEIDMPITSINIAAHLKSLQRQARQEARGAPYAVYALLDPIDQETTEGASQFDGIPFYVGQSSQVEIRLRQHFRSSRKLEGDSQMVHRRIADMLAAGRLPRLAILEIARTRSQSLMGELRWGQHMMRAGFALANTSPDMIRPMEYDELDAWLEFRRRSMLASEAAREGAVIVHGCICGRADRLIDPADYAACWSRRMRVLKIANGTRQCPRCGRECEWWLGDRRLLMASFVSDYDQPAPIANNSSS